TVAAYKGADTLVLGAFGCGAFKNNPKVVARAYKTALQEFPKVFERIVFAVYCSEWDSKNYDVFNATFKNLALARIFLEAPKHWGLRGDPFFWDYLRTQSEKKDIESPEELEKWIMDEFLKLSGEEMTEKSEVQIKKFSHGTKNTGTVSGNWWIKKGIPLLKSRMQ
ncbi:MAG: TIGR02452 family protein, partial [Lachnospiraceae bacterium]|nr:TIGR02452 family protein [Lachnospiraceae bacterium]